MAQEQNTIWRMVVLVCIDCIFIFTNVYYSECDTVVIDYGCLDAIREH